VVDLRALARNRECAVRSPVCTFDTATTVLAHVRMSGISGMGHKAPDVLGAYACHPCHTLCDTGQYMDVHLSRDERDLLLLRGMARTIAMLVKEGVLTW
jgi:hypothetical protein